MSSSWNRILSQRRSRQLCLWSGHNKATRNTPMWKVCQQEMSKYLSVWRMC